MLNPSKQSKVLILGGTSDARRLAIKLIEININVVYSIAGLVRTPKLDCLIHIGGFTLHGGLEQYIQEHHISIILDATHPYALNISQKATLACIKTNIQYVRFERPQWQMQQYDLWTTMDSWQQVISKLEQFKRVFLTAGQVAEPIMTQLTQLSCDITLRTAKPPDYNLPKNITWIKAIGPFDEKSEKKWLKDNQIELIVSKNSGGSATYGKIAAARELGINVFMFNRPQNSKVTAENIHTFDDLNSCIDYILQIKTEC